MNILREAGLPADYQGTFPVDQKNQTLKVTIYLACEKRYPRALGHTCSVDHSPYPHLLSLTQDAQWTSLHFFVVQWALCFSPYFQKIRTENNLWKTTKARPVLPQGTEEKRKEGWWQQEPSQTNSFLRQFTYITKHQRKNNLEHTTGHYFS